MCHDTHASKGFLWQWFYYIPGDLEDEGEMSAGSDAEKRFGGSAKLKV
jgi:hypothetical protein